MITGFARQQIKCLFVCHCLSSLKELTYMDNGQCLLIEPLGVWQTTHTWFSLLSVFVSCYCLFFAHNKLINRCVYNPTSLQEQTQCIRMTPFYLINSGFLGRFSGLYLWNYIPVCLSLPYFSDSRFGVACFDKLALSPTTKTFLG